MGPAGTLSGAGLLPGGDVEAEDVTGHADLVAVSELGRGDGDRVEHDRLLAVDVEDGEAAVRVVFSSSPDGGPARRRAVGEPVFHRLGEQVIRERAVLRNGRVRLVAGGSGGPRIISATLQTILGVLAEGRTAAEAVDAPRIHHQWQPDVLLMERGTFGTAKQPIQQSTADALLGRGHTLDGRPYLAAVNAVEVTGTRAVAAPDPRKRTPPAP